MNRSNDFGAIVRLMSGPAVKLNPRNFRSCGRATAHFASFTRLRPRHVAPKRGQAYEPEVPVKVRKWIGPALAAPDFVLDAQPPAQPHSGVVVDRPIRFGTVPTSK